MGSIRVDSKYDFEELVDILLRNKYETSVSASMYDDDGEEIEDREIAFYVVEYTDTDEY